MSQVIAASQMQDFEHAFCLTVAMGSFMQDLLAVAWAIRMHLGSMLQAAGQFCERQHRRDNSVRHFFRY